MIAFGINGSTQTVLCKRCLFELLRVHLLSCSSNCCWLTVKLKRFAAISCSRCCLNFTCSLAPAIGVYVLTETYSHGLSAIVVCFQSWILLFCSIDDLQISTCRCEIELRLWKLLILISANILNHYRLATIIVTDFRKTLVLCQQTLDFLLANFVIDRFESHTVQRFPLQVASWRLRHCWVMVVS